jgi:DNA-binding transcriptional ArsR family regulator
LWLQPEAEAAAARQAKVFKALADPNRVRIVTLLAHHPSLSGTEIATGTGMSMALFVHHWRILHESGLIVSRKEGQTRYCALDRTVLRNAVADLLDEH